MTQTNKAGVSKLVEQCSLPLTGVECIHHIITDLAVMDVTQDGLYVKELAPGVTKEMFSEACGGKHTFAQDIKTIEV
jgi:3-oxoacid CoA-transferase subunit B